MPESNGPKKTGWEIAALVLAFLRDLIRLIWELKGHHF
jgi:hypothetical protein